jgi:hypothetical protein
MSVRVAPEAMASEFALGESFISCAKSLPDDAKARSYSYRSAVSGSMRAARRAGR